MAFTRFYKNIEVSRTVRGKWSAENVRNVLPEHALKIYLAAFNHARDTYRNPVDHKGNASREETAHKVAWAAAKQPYEKGDDK